MSFALGRRSGQRARESAPLQGQAAPLQGAAVPVAGVTVRWWAVLSAGLSPLVLVSGWLVGGAVQPASYSPVRETVSVLSGYQGTDRWIMTSAMVLAGGCYLVTALGLAGLRPSARLLLLVSGLCSLGVAASPEPQSGPGPVHLAWTVLGALTITTWPAVAGWRAPPASAAVSPRVVVAATAFFVATLAWVMLEIEGGDVLGLAERATASLPPVWPFVVALLLWRRNRREPASHGAT